MSPPLHSPKEIAAFLGDGETRLIAAAYCDPALSKDLYILEDGTAREIRGWARINLRCPFPDCPQPQFKTVARAPRRRDGFSHLSGAHKHAPESINHIQGKAVIAAWLTKLLGSDAVKVEIATDTQRSRVADVMAVLPSGQRVAFEIQYAALSVQQWVARHESYRAQGIIDVWLWGHTRLGSPRHRPNGRDGSDVTRFTVPDVQVQVRDSGLPVLFLNPERGAIAVAVNPWENDWTFVFERETELAVNQLGDYNVDGSGLVSDLILRFLATEERRQAHLNEEEIERRSQLRNLRSLLGLRLAALAAFEAEKQIQDEARERARAQLRIRRAEAEERLRADNARRAAEPIESRRTTVREGGPWTHCLKCGLTLDPVYANVGYHTLCAPRWLGGRDTTRLNASRAAQALRAYSAQSTRDVGKC